MQASGTGAAEETAKAATIIKADKTIIALENTGEAGTTLVMLELLEDAGDAGDACGTLVKLDGEAGKFF